MLREANAEGEKRRFLLNSDIDTKMIEIEGEMKKGNFLWAFLELVCHQVHLLPCLVEKGGDVKILCPRHAGEHLLPLVHGIFGSGVNIDGDLLLHQFNQIRHLMRVAEGDYCGFQLVEPALFPPGCFGFMD